MGGLAITQAAEAMPDKIKMLVYLTAFLLPSGKTCWISHKPSLRPK